MTSLRFYDDAANINCVRKSWEIFMKNSVRVKTPEGSTARFVLNSWPSLNLPSLLSCLKTRQLSLSVRANTVTWFDRPTVLDGTVCGACTVFVLP